MKQYIIFLSLVIIFFSCSFAQVASQKGASNVEVEEFKKHTSISSVHLLDVRTPKEYQEGHIDGAKNIDYFDKSFKTELSKLNKNLPVYVYCRSGGRSGKAMQIMKEIGFVDVYNLKGGFLAWSQQ